MGTRADFYVGRGPEAEWLGSIAFDGDPNGTANATLALHATDAAAYRSRVAALLARCDHATKPEQGWPWPWDDSRTTDYAYAFDGERVWGSSFGEPWWPAIAEPERWDEEAETEIDVAGEPATFPDMSARKNVQFGGKRSGIMVISRTPEGWDVR